MPRHRLFPIILIISGFFAYAQEDLELETLDTFTVFGARGLEWQESGGYSGSVWDDAFLDLQTGTTLADQLQGKDGARLFRRQSTLAAHPTTQGLALRVGGPNGASRSAVFLDGIPINDAFGGWIPWTAIPASTIANASLIQPSGVHAVGLSDFGGIMLIESRFHLDDEPFFSLEFAGGRAVDHRLANAFMTLSSSGQTRLFGSWSTMESTGYHIIREADRGGIDRRATLQADALELGIRHDWESGWSVGGSLRYHEEDRGNGTPMAVNASRAWQGSLRLAKERGADDWEHVWTAFYQTRDFESVFTSVSTDRDSERRVLDQFDVPSEAIGVVGRSRLWLGDHHEILFGLDSQYASGETNERFRNLGNGFTRQRQAGGRRWEAGAVAEYSWRPNDAWSVHGSLRLDYTLDREGDEKQWNLETDELLSEARFGNQEDWRVSARVASDIHLSPDTTLRLTGFTGTRRPTLNELYRPFRVGNDITLANADLETERVWGVTSGLEWSVAPNITLQLEGFYHWLDDAVANVTLTEGGGVVEPWGFIPAGGSGRQRRNLDRVDVKGLEAGFLWETDADWILRAGYLLTDSEIRRSKDQPDLAGAQLAQMPEHQAYASLGYDGGGKLRAQLEGRWTSRVADDDLNTRYLEEAFVVNASIGWRFTPEIEGILSVENLFDEAIQVSRSGTGVIGVGTPRIWQAGVRLEF